MDAPRAKTIETGKVALSEFSGHFYSPELTTEYVFAVEEEFLIAKHSRLSDIKLTHVKEDIFTGNQWFFGRVEFTRDENKTITGCKVSSGRVRDLKFEKNE